MFDFAWSEIAVIAAVALVLIGPKDMPVAIRTITGMVKKARGMAGEFRTHVDEMLREANLDEVKNSINEIRNFDLKTVVEREIDPDGSLRGTFADNPLEPAAAVVADTASADAEPAPPAEPEVPPVPLPPPDFMPPGAVSPHSAWAGTPTLPPDETPEPPAFIPPEVASAARAKHVH